MFMAFDNISNAASSSRVSPASIMPMSSRDSQLFKSHKTASLLVAGFREMQQQQQQQERGVKRLSSSEYNVDENNTDSNNNNCENNESGCTDTQSCDSVVGIKQVAEEHLLKSNTNTAKGGAVEKKIKKHRYAFQTRSHVDILDDGYKWRKYGQKSVKNNKFPRSYYRCTHQGCNVKKQVQRVSKDEGLVITTYEGVHSHPTIQNSTDNFEHILTQMHIYHSTCSSL